MSKQTDAPLQVVFIVTCYQNIIGVYSNQEDAFRVQLDCISKNRSADVLCRSITYSSNL